MNYRPPHTIHLDGHTDVGIKRANNEDAWWCGQPGGDFSSMTELRAPLALVVGETPVVAIVSDGVGGAQAGEVASQMAISELSREIGERRYAFSQVEAAKAALREALHATDAAVRRKAGEPSFDGMGATVSALCFLPGREAVWGQAGDSRIYRYRAHQLQQLSRDHSPVGRMRQEGVITEEEARRHQLRNQIDQSLGDPNNPFKPDVESITINPEDVYLLCSDGLSDGLWDREIAAGLAALRRPADLRACVRHLVEAAKQASGRDNITALACLVEA